MELANCTPREAVMIGDRIDNDILPAKALGMHTVWIRQGFGGLWNISNPEEQTEHTADSLTELFQIL